MPISFKRPVDAASSPAPGFNYCGWSKRLVSLVLLPLLAFIGYRGAALYGGGPLLSWIAALSLPSLAVYGAIKIDAIPWLQRKFTPCRLWPTAGHDEER